MTISLDPPIEKVHTGAIVIIPGEYIPVDNADHEIQEDVIFLIQGEEAPKVGDTEIDWKLLEAFDFTC